MAIILLVYSSLLIEARKVKLQIKRHGTRGTRATTPATATATATTGIAAAAATAATTDTRTTTAVVVGVARGVQ